MKHQGQHATIAQDSESPDSERKRRRDCVEESVEVERDRFERIVERSFQATEQRLFAEYDRRIEPIIEQRAQRFEERLKQRYQQKFEQNVHQKFGITVDEETLATEILSSDIPSVPRGLTGSKQLPEDMPTRDCDKQPGTVTAVVASYDTQKAENGIPPSRQTWRVRGVPTNISEEELSDILRHHKQLFNPETSAVVGSGAGNDNSVHSLALDLNGNLVATIRFIQLPVRLRTVDPCDQVTIDLHLSPEKRQSSISQTSALPSRIKVSIDQHFTGITVLSSPASSEHEVDILAISGLGSHPFGSFIHKGDGHMWLSESLPRDMPTARVMIYGYESGLQGSTSFTSLDDLASSLYLGICNLLRSKNQKKLIIIGHSLGGLLVKEVLIRIAESDSDSDLMHWLFGGIFFGVPNDGLDVESLIPIVSNQPNHFFVRSLSTMGSQILKLQRGNFAKFLSHSTFEMFCFYETRLSRTAAKDPRTGKYKMIGEHRCLVTQSSATSCLPATKLSERSFAIDRTHSDMVKFASHDFEYDKVRYVIGRMYERCLEGAREPSDQQNTRQESVATENRGC